MLPSEVLTEGFLLWLDELAGNFRPVVPPDPLRTSLRSAHTIQTWLTNVDLGAPIAPNPHRRTQAVTDLRGTMGLLDGTGDSPVLTSLGRQVLHRWAELGISGPGDAQEIARWAALVRAGLGADDPAVRALYWPRYLAWERLAHLPNAGYWLEADLVRLHLPYYLASPDSRGYTPFSVFVAISQGRIGPTAEWDAWAQKPWAGAAHLQSLLSTIRSFRVGGALSFRRGLEVVRAAREQDRALPSLLDEWGVSQ